MQPPSSNFLTFSGVVLLGLASVAVAHGHDEDVNMNMGMPSMAQPTTASGANVTLAETYFRHSEHSGLLAAHIFLMTIAWIFILPIGIQLPQVLKENYVDFIRCYAIDFSISIQPVSTIRLPRSKRSRGPTGHHLQRQHAGFVPK